MDTINQEEISIYHVAAIPYPGRSHINAMMNVCRLLSSKHGLVMTFVVTEEWLGLIDSEPKPPNVRLRSIPNVVPSELARAADMGGFFEAIYTKMEGTIEQLLDQLEPPVSCIVADTLLAWAVAVGSWRNIPVASLWPMSPSVFSINYHFHLLQSNGHFPTAISERGDETVCYIPGISSIRLRDLPITCHGKHEIVRRRIREAFSWVPKAQVLLLTSFYELEAHVTDTLRAHLSIPIYTIGPSIPYLNLQDEPTTPKGTDTADYYNWLDSQPSRSVLYVSLGSYLAISDRQMDEITMGLRDSGAHFLWATRGNSPYLQEVSNDIGLVVPWCDQLRVLCHPSIGAFFTHCGWNSTMESIYAGVIMLTFPLGFDQFTNAKLIVEDWKVGVRVRREVGTENVVKREKITETVQWAMKLDCDESREIRRRAKDLQETCKKALEEGGSSNTNLNVFVRDILCGHD